MFSENEFNFLGAINYRDKLVFGEFVLKFWSFLKQERRNHQKPFCLSTKMMITILHVDEN